MIFRSAFWKQFDWILVASAVLLTLFGIVSMMSTSTPTGELIGKPVILQSAALLISLAAFFFVARIEYRSLQSFASFLFAFGTLLLVLVLVVGEYRNGSRSWFNLGITTVQPAEFMKLFFIVTLAWYFSRHPVHSVKTILISLLLLAPILLLIILEPDVGTMLVFVAIWFIMCLQLNLTRKQRTMFVLASGAVVVGGLIAALFFVSPEHFQIQRLRVFPDHLFLTNTYHTEIGYQVDQSLIAIGSGGIEGKGLGHGSQSQLGFLPAQTTDFIFASITEEIGLLGAFIIIALLTIVLIRILKNAQLARDRFGRFMCIGIFALIFYHSFQNIAMNLGLMPVTGIPLSLVSLGGSHLFTVFVSLGLVESVVLRAKSPVHSI